MDRQLARVVVVSALRSSSELANLLPLLKQHCSEAEFAELRDAIADAMNIMGQRVVARAFAEHPDLEAEAEAQIEKYGRFV